MFSFLKRRAFLVVIGFLLIALFLTYLVYPARASRRITRLDIALAIASVIAFAWPLVSLDTFRYRAATPTTPPRH